MFARPVQRHDSFSGCCSNRCRGLLIEVADRTIIRQIWGVRKIKCPSEGRLLLGLRPSFSLTISISVTNVDRLTKMVSPAPQNAGCAGRIRKDVAPVFQDVDRHRRLRTRPF